MSDREIARAHADEIGELGVEQSTRLLADAHCTFEAAKERYEASQSLYRRARLLTWAALFMWLASFALLISALSVAPIELTGVCLVAALLGVMLGRRLFRHLSDGEPNRPGYIERRPDSSQARRWGTAPGGEERHRGRT